MTHGETLFFKLNAVKAPFFVDKLGIKTLPSICCFENGVLKEQIIGFEEFGGTDSFKTINMIRRFASWFLLLTLIGWCLRGS